MLKFTGGRGPNIRNREMWIRAAGQVMDKQQSGDPPGRQRQTHRQTGLRQRSGQVGGSERHAPKALRTSGREGGGRERTEKGMSGGKAR